MTNRDEVRRALRARALTIPGLTSQKFDVAGVSSSRPPGQWWVRESFRPGVTRLQTIPANGGRMRTEGLYLLDGFLPAGKGEVAADTFAVDAVTAFPAGLVLAYGTSLVTIRDASAAGELTDSPWLHVPITVRWYSDTLNTLDA